MSLQSLVTGIILILIGLLSILSGMDFIKRRKSYGRARSKADHLIWNWHVRGGSKFFKSSFYKKLMRLHISTLGLLFILVGIILFIVGIFVLLPF